MFKASISNLGVTWWCHLRRFRSSGRWRWPAICFAFAPVFGCVAYGIGLRGGVTCAALAARADGDGRPSFISPLSFPASFSSVAFLSLALLDVMPYRSMNHIVP